MFPLIAENLVVEFNGKHILGPLDLTVNKGDILLILGPNGSGKTTLLKSLHGIMKLKRGSIKWSCSDKSSMQKQMFVFQTPIMLSVQIVLIIFINFTRNHKTIYYVHLYNHALLLSCLTI